MLVLGLWMAQVLLIGGSAYLAPVRGRLAGGGAVEVAAWLSERPDAEWVEGDRARTTRSCRPQRLWLALVRRRSMKGDGVHAELTRNPRGALR